MTLETTVEVDGDRAVVVKRSPAHAVEQLRREGERLRRASHPGVVQVLRSAPAGDGWELRTAHAGRPLSILDARTVPQVAAVVAAVASTLADLHALGIVHGRLDASHVLVGEQGRPVLCGFGDGAADARPEDDVAAVGRLLTSLLAREDDAEPIPERWWRPRPTVVRVGAPGPAAPGRPGVRRTGHPSTHRPPAGGGHHRGGARRRPRRPVPHRGGPTGPGCARSDRARCAAASTAPTRHDGRARSARVALAVVGASLLVALGLRLRGRVVRLVAHGRGRGVPPSTTSSALPPCARPDRSPGPCSRWTGGATASARRVTSSSSTTGTATVAPPPRCSAPRTGEVFVFPILGRRRPARGGSPPLQVAGAEALVSRTDRRCACPTLLVRTASGDVPVRRHGVRVMRRRRRLLVGAAGSRRRRSSGCSRSARTLLAAPPSPAAGRRWTAWYERVGPVPGDDGAAAAGRSAVVRSGGSSRRRSCSSSPTSSHATGCRRGRTPSARPPSGRWRACR